uniref:Ubiquitin carboxyl-terminal hydrolase 47 C-terminal domain-containing protein n=1 Tax=Amphimedon queenslandica TaxID=400682 RepID=A0A1X7TG15_AMPQE
QTILDDIRKYFSTSKVGVIPETKDHDVVPLDNKSTDEIMELSNPQSDTSSDVKAASSQSQALSPQAKIHVPVPKDLLTNFRSMRMSYGRMFYNVGKIIKRKSPPLEEIKELLSCCGTEVLKQNAEQCTNIPNVLRLIQNECSLTDIELLHSVVEEMEITEATRYIEAYKTDLKEFCKSLSISLCLKERFACIPHLQCETVTFIFDWEPEEHVLKDIKDILSKVSGKLLVIKYIETSTSISVTCSFPFSDVGFTVLRMIENIHILMGQGLKKLTIGNLTLWRRQNVRQKELKEKDQDLLQYTEVISYIILEEAEYKLRDAVSSKEKVHEAIKLKQEQSIVTVPKEESLSVQSDIDSIKEVEEEPLYEELTVLGSQCNEMQKENKELSDKLLKMKVDYLRSLSINIGSAASKVRRGMTFEIDDCKFHLEAMARPDYQPLVDNKRILEKLQERITLMNMELMTKREHNEKIIKDIKDLKEAKEKRQREKEEQIEKEMCLIILYCNHPVTGEFMESTLKVHKDELLLIVLDKAYKLMELAPHIPIERCRLVKYSYEDDLMEQSLDFEFQHLTIGQIIGGARHYYPFGLFLETREENEIFDKYHDGGINLMISVVNVSTGEVGPAKPVRGEGGWTVGVLKQHIGELYNLNSSCMRLVMEELNDVTDISSDVRSTLGKIFRKSTHNDRQLVYVLSDPEDYQKEFNDSLMYKYVYKLYRINSILLKITIPPAPEATATTTNVPKGGIIMKIISINEENKGKERKIQVQVDKRITLAQLKEKLVPLIGVPSTGFRVYEIRYDEECELDGLDETLVYMGMHIQFGSEHSELIVRLGRALRRGECRIKLYLLQVNNTEFCKYMMESIVAKGTPVREFKEQIIEEAKVQGIDCVLELDKMRLRFKKARVLPDKVYLDHDLIDTSMEMYVEPLKEPDKMKYHWQVQVYVRRWHPSQHSIDPTEEVILDTDFDYNHIIKKLSELSGVPVQYVSYGKVARLLFPAKLSWFDIENNLNWNSFESWLDSSENIHFHDSLENLRRLVTNGDIIYYKDNRETMKELTDKERSEIKRLRKQGQLLEMS